MADKEKEGGNYVQSAIPKFDGHYDHWAMLMENLLRSKEYWEVVEKGISAMGATTTQEQKKAHDEAKLRDLKAKNYLFQAIDRNILETILNLESAKEIWESLKLKYKGSNKVKRAQLQALRCDYEVLKMKDGESVSDYFARTLSIVNKMKSHGENLGETIVIEKIMRSMCPKFNYVVCSIEQANDVEKLTIDGLQSNLLVDEHRMNGQKEEEQVLKVTTSSRGKGRDVELEEVEEGKAPRKE